MAATLAYPKTNLVPDYEGTHRFSIDDYHRLAEIGVLDWEEPVELLGGYIVEKGGREPSELRPLSNPQWSGLRRFTVPEYHAMIADGILTADDPVELLDGFLVLKMPRNPPHDGAIDLFRTAVTPLVTEGLMLRCQQAVSLLDSEPEPDFAIVKGEPAAFTKRHPKTADILLVAEISDSTLGKDRRLKGESFARNRIPVYWIVNIIDGWVEVYTEPDAAATPPAYAARTDYRAGDAVPLAFDGTPAGSVPVAALLP